MAFYRKVSPVEVSYLARDTAKSTLFLNQFILSGVGDLKLKDWQLAVKEASLANPGIMLKLKGHWGFRHWDDQGSQPLVEKVSTLWRGMNSESAEHINRVIDPRKGPAARVVLMDHPDGQNILFQCHHALTDGVGGLHLTKDIFRVLRGEEPIGSYSKACEFDIVQKMGESFKPAPIGNSLSVFKASNQPGLKGCRWQSFRWNGSREMVLAKLLCALAEIARETHGEGKVQFRIPSDLRRYLDKNDGMTLANASSVFNFSVEPGETPKEVQKRLLAAMLSKDDLRAFPNAAPYAKWAPKYVFLPKAHNIEAMHRNSRYRFTGMISFVSDFKLADFSYDKFQCHSVQGVPIALDDRSVFMGIIMTDKGASGSIGVPNALADAEELNYLVEELYRRLDAYSS